MVLTCFSIAGIQPCPKARNRKNRQFPLPLPSDSPSSRSVREETKSQEVKPRPWGSAAYSLAPKLTFSYHSYPEMQGHPCAPVHWALLHQLAINEMPHRQAHRPIQLSFLLPREHNTGKTSSENHYSYECGLKSIPKS